MILPVRTSLRILLGGLICGLTGVPVGSPLVAAARPGSIAGTLRNDQGQAFSGVAIDVVSPTSSKYRVSVKSDVDGHYKIADVPPGTYSLKFVFLRKYDSAAPFGAGRMDCANRDKVVVRAGRQTAVDAALKDCGEFTYESMRILG